MTGYFVIYECSENQWLYEGVRWINDRDYYPHMIGTKHGIRTQQSYTSMGMEMDIFDIQSEPVLVDGGSKVIPELIMKFKTIAEAEEYLLKSFSPIKGNFYSIRKIYY
jgi:hypothetical protein